MTSLDHLIEHVPPLIANEVGTLDTDAVFTDFDLFIRSKPGLSGSDYPDESSYRAAVLRLAKQRVIASNQLAVASLLTPPNPELLASLLTTHGFEWRTNQLLYRGPDLDYRLASMLVLNAYINGWRRERAHLNPRTFTYKTIVDVKHANTQVGQGWFHAGLRVVDSRLINGKYFITRVKDRTIPRHLRRFSVHVALPDGTIQTIGEYRNLDQANETIDELLAVGESTSVLP